MKPGKRFGGRLAREVEEEAIRMGLSRRRCAEVGFRDARDTA